MVLTLWSDQLLSGGKDHVYSQFLRQASELTIKTVPLARTEMDILLSGIEPINTEFFDYVSGKEFSFTAAGSNNAILEFLEGC